jgi:hypothetical protein
VDGDVHDLTWTGPHLNRLRLSGAAAGTSLDALLAERRLPGLEDRVPVLAYGGNRNPATLALKLQHYDYVSPGHGIVLPVLAATMRGFDVVAGGLSPQGYLYATLLADERTTDTELAVHVLLLDDDQLRVMNDSEGVRTGLYDVAALDQVRLAGLPGPAAEISALAYLSVQPVVISETVGTPLAFSAVRAIGRTLPEFDAVGMLAHILIATDLTEQTRAVVAAGLDGDGVMDLADPLVLADELMRYLNGQWWYRQHTGERRLLACERLEALIFERLSKSMRSAPDPDRTVAGLHRLSADDAYRPGPAHSLGPASRST